jgi:hypothetical protein
MGSTSSKDGDNTNNNMAFGNEAYYRVKGGTKQRAPSQKST